MNRSPKKDFELDLKLKREIHEVRRKEVKENDIEFTSELFSKTLKLLRKKISEKFNFILKAGNSYLFALHKLFELVWTTGKKPDKWRDSVLIQLWKGKGDKADLNSRRHLHTRDQTQKYFGHMVITAAKPKILKEISPFQIGAIPGHRAQEHLFTLKSVMAITEKNNSSIALQLLDLSKLFDRECLIDCLDELYKTDIKGKLYQLLYELNKDTRIRVRTVVGDSESEETGENLAQGSMEASLGSSVNISRGVSDFFSSSEYEVSYGPIKLQPQSFMDDLGRFCADPVSAQIGNDRFESMAEVKLLDYNLDKSRILFLGKKKERNNLRKKFQEKAPTLYGKTMKESQHESYLGDEIGKSLSESITMTIQKRTGLVKKSIFEIKSIVENYKSQMFGGIQVGMLLWEACVIPYPINNSSTWLQINQKDLNTLIKLENLFFHNILGVQKCPSLLMSWDLGSIVMPLRILKEKLLLYHHIRSLPVSSLAHQFLLVQEKYNFPSLKDEIGEFLAEFEVSDVKKFTKVQWRNFVKDKIKQKNRTFLLEGMSKYKKLDSNSLALEECGMKEYFRTLNLSDARLKFRIRSKCVNTCQTHFPSHQGYIMNSFRCNNCSEFEIDQLSHWHRCKLFKDKFGEIDNNDEKSIIQFYRNVIKFRHEQEIV